MTHPQHNLSAIQVRPQTAVFVSICSAMFLALAGPALSNPVEATRARVAPSHMALPQASARLCWARYATRAAQNSDIIEEVAFRVPCPEQMTTDFIATLQRALNARGHYDGPINGRTDGQTRAAVQKFQRAQGFDSPILTLDTAQHLGLLPVELGGY
ncbi:peptidoglycan-binding domain-containing protein [Roseinatronobacter alkalisoli]|uniref:Peptidoglycan-binding domain-containing protein n=1 Tax=Roseinatronobacter alkalisoli TaxID=3028235 RepID=A0ABT5T3X0_9RHOB|nr:peptidoglycan-binding domain-containing protein [Roseinatronobacter sp. HJB301]MDD7969818.1 peptidoglycan-binding domain-containing protein [Roseinatronobacter sp. HJB301]